MSADQSPLTGENAQVGYVRDRSLYSSRPSGGHAPRIHKKSVTRPGMTACDTRFILLDTDRPITLLDDADQKRRWCLRCFPPGSAIRVSRPSCKSCGRVREGQRVVDLQVGGFMCHTPCWTDALDQAVPPNEPISRPRGG